MTIEKTATPYFKPDWFYALNLILGDIIGKEGYITEYGTFKLTGDLMRKEDHSKYESDSQINGPVAFLTAKSSLGLI